MGSVRWPGGESPRQKLIQRGASALSDPEVLSLLLGTGYGGCSALQLATDLLQRFGGLCGLAAAPWQSLQAAPGVGEARYGALCAATELARRQALESLAASDVLSSPQTTRRFLQCHLGHRPREVFSCIFLDSQHKVICCEDLFMGTLDGAAVYPREVAVRALLHRSAAVILAHNHPSGVAEPSSADKRITARLQEALGLLDIRVLDHIIVGRGQGYSFAEAGLL